MRLLAFFHPRTARDFSEDKRDHTSFHPKLRFVFKRLFSQEGRIATKGPLRTLSPLQKGPLPGFKNLPSSARVCFRKKATFSKKA